MSRINRWALWAIAICVCLMCQSTSRAGLIFSDDFQSDAATQSGVTTDFDPAISGSDTGGVWNVIESPALAVQVLNDTVPGNGIPGLDNYLRIYRGGGPASRGAPYAQGWNSADTLDQVVKLDMLVYRPTGSAMSVFFGNALHSGSVSTGVNNFAGNSTVQASLDTSNLPANQWLPVQIMANMSSSLTQEGILPQQWTLSVNGGAPVASNFAISGNQVPAILVGLTQGNETFNYVDNVVIQVIPEPSSLVLLGLGFVGLIFCRRKK
jgi:hypothetical protein